MRLTDSWQSAESILHKLSEVFMGQGVVINGPMYIVQCSMNSYAETLYTVATVCCQDRWDVDGKTDVLAQGRLLLPPVTLH